MQNPRGSRPSIAASARVGDMNARDSVIRIERPLLPSRMASDLILHLRLHPKEGDRDAAV